MPRVMREGTEKRQAATRYVVQGVPRHQENFAGRMRSSAIKRTLRDTGLKHRACFSITLCNRPQSVG